MPIKLKANNGNIDLKAPIKQVGGKVDSVNGMTGDVVLDIPSKTSDLVNDSGFLTQIPDEYVTEAELDAKGYLTEHQSLAEYAKKSEIPDVSGFLTSIPDEYVTEAELDAKGYLTNYTESDPIYTADKPNIALKSEIPTVPTKVSAFTNDAGYLTEHQSLEGYATDEELAAKQDKLTAGNNITIVNNVISASGGGSYELPMASASTLGGIKVGTGLSIDTNGVLSLALTNANGVSF